VAFLVAGVLFMASVVAVLVTTRTSSDSEGTGDIPQAAAYRVQANGLADILLESPGFVSGSTPEDWSDGATYAGRVPAADSLARLGLLDAQATSPKMLDFAKFQNLRSAPFATADDDFVNYEEARRTLGLEKADMDFHIRAYPSLQSVKDLLACGVQCKDPNLRVSYVGDIEPPSATGSVAPTAVELGPSPGVPPALSCSVSPNPKAYRISSTIINNGISDTQIRGVFDIQFSNGPRYTKTVNSPVLVPNVEFAGNPPTVGSSTTFNLDVPAYDGRVCGSGTRIELELYDSNQRLTTVGPTVLATGITGATASAKDLWLESATYFIGGADTVKVTYDGTAAGNGFKNQDFTLVVYNGEGTSGAVEFVQNVQSSNSGKGGDIVVGTGLPLGVHTAVLYDGLFAGSDNAATAAAAQGSSALRVSARVNVVAAPGPGPYTPYGGSSSGSANYVFNPLGVVPTEVFFLEGLIQKFCPTYVGSKTESPIPPAGWGGDDGDAWGVDAGVDRWTTGSATSDWEQRCSSFKAGAVTELNQPGDVFPDRKNPLRNQLVPRLICNQPPPGCPDGRGPGLASAKDQPRYDLVRVLIIGSNVDHNELAPAEIKYALEDWVKGGGTLIVLGSLDQSVNWLMPILKTGIKSSSGGVSVPDAAHPILHVPDELDYANYKNGNQVWDFRGSHDADELFTQVVAQGSTTDFEPILAVSNPGAIQDETTGTSGTVILTTWMPADVFRGNDPGRRVDEGRKFLNNLLMMGYGDLYLDYGPPIPQGANVVPAIRYAQIQHPDFADPIQLSLNVFVFGGR
jgi:hypothetical protein